MKAADLMIGDWVIRRGVPEEPMRLYGMNVSMGIAYLDQDGRGVSEKFENIEPISLTEEILKKNGFHCQDNYYAIADLSKADSFWSIKIIFATEHPTYITQIEIENVDGNDVINVGMSAIGGKIYYVHELQHSLKQSKIKKEVYV